MIAQKSLSWIIAPLIVAFLSFFLWATPFALIFVVISIFFIIFFRDPKRKIGNGIVAPADGKIKSIENTKDSVKISTIMGLQHVHVNRVPFSGKVMEIKHLPGKHRPAFDKDSGRNERVITILDTKIGKIEIVQIAGAFARRIVPYTTKGDTLSRGQRLGIIRFGSRVDLYLPKNCVTILVEEGSKVKAGESTLAKVKKDEDR